MSEFIHLHHTHVDPHHAKRWAVLAVLSVAQLMVVLDSTIVNIALPQMQTQLGFSDASRQWAITAYALAFGSLLLFGGRLGDLFGAKGVFITGLIGFAVTSAIGGAAGSFAILIAARAGQGVFGALLAPGALAILTNTFTDPRERAKAFGIFGATAGTGAATGLLLGGLLTEYLSWRWCLYVNLAFALPAAIAGSLLLHRIPHPDKPSLDLPGIFTATLGLFGIVLGFSRAEADGWLAPTTLIAIIGGIILLAFFMIIERNVKHPLLPLRVPRDRFRGGAYLIMGIAAIGMFAVFLFLTYYLQTVLDFSPVRTGFAFLPMPIATTLIATLATTTIVPRFGPRLLMTGGMLLSGSSMLIFTRLGMNSSYLTDVLPALILGGLGMGCIFAPAFITGTFGVERGDAGIASALLNTAQQVGGSIGTALLTTIVTGATRRYVELNGGAATSDIDALSSQIHGFSVGFAVAAGILIGGAAITFLLLPRGVPKGFGHLPLPQAH